MSCDSGRCFRQRGPHDAEDRETCRVGAVPVVGGDLDATETMLSGAALARPIGIFGMLCVAAICFVPFVRAGASYLCYKAGLPCSPLCSDGMKRFLENVGAALVCCSAC
ncbi:MAG: stage III sporulation protein AE [Butyricicoccus sp.]